MCYLCLVCNYKNKNKNNSCQQLILRNLLLIFNIYLSINAIIVNCSNLNKRIDQIVFKRFVFKQKTYYIFYVSIIHNIFNNNKIVNFDCNYKNFICLIVILNFVRNTIYLRLLFFDVLETILFSKVLKILVFKKDINNSLCKFVIY